MLNFLFRRQKLSNVLILGSGRSGSSILGELFENLSEFNYIFEPKLDEILDQLNEERTCIKVPKGGSCLTGGLACDMDELIDILGKNLKILWIIRNPLDTICSLKPGIEDNWSHNPKPPNYMDLLDKPWYIKGAYHWNYINNEGFASASRFGPLFKVKYEDLINNPRDTLSELLNFIDADNVLEELSNYMELLSNNTHDSYHAKFQVHWYRNNHKTRINRYKENMTKNEQLEAYKIVKPVADRFDYNYSL